MSLIKYPDCENFSLRKHLKDWLLTVTSYFSHGTKKEPLYCAVSGPSNAFAQLSSEAMSPTLWLKFPPLPYIVWANSKGSYETSQMCMLAWALLCACVIRTFFTWAGLIKDYFISETDGINIDKYEQPHDKTNKMTGRPAKTQISQGIRPVWSAFSLSAWRKLGLFCLPFWVLSYPWLATHWAHSEDYDQTVRIPRLIWVFAGHPGHIVGFIVQRLKYFLPGTSSKEEENRRQRKERLG